MAKYTMLGFHRSRNFAVKYGALSFNSLIMIQIGPYRIDVLETCLFALDGGAMFGVVPKNLWSKAYDPGDSQNRIPMAARNLLVRWEGHTMLVDTGNGTKLTEKQKQIYGLDNSVHTLEASLAAHGLTHSDISDVFLTHLHFDHAGGATTVRDNQVVPTFENARYYVQREHYEWALKPSEKDRASFWPENYQPIVESGAMNFVEGDSSIFPNIDCLCFHGHTPALQMLRIQADGQTLVFPADLFPTHAHVPVPYVMGYDNHPLTTIDEKKRILPQAAEENWIVVFEHDAHMVAGRISHGDKGFRCSEAVEMNHD